MTSWVQVLAHAQPGEHVVQLYGNDDRLLVRNVGRYLAEGLRRGDGVVVVATPTHLEAIGRLLAEDRAEVRLEAERDGRLVFLDARDTLHRLLRDGEPDDALFRQVIGSVLEGARARASTGQVRAFGEMVDLLWSQGRPEAAARLERLWNAVLSDHACSLYCAYRLDLFAPLADVAALTAIVGSHTHLLAGPATVLSNDRVAS